MGTIVECWPTFLFQQNVYVACAESSTKVTQIAGPCNTGWALQVEMVLFKLASVYCWLSQQSQGLKCASWCNQINSVQAASRMKTRCDLESENKERALCPPDSNHPCANHGALELREKNRAAVSSCCKFPRRANRSKLKPNTVAETDLEHLLPRRAKAE